MSRKRSGSVSTRPRSGSLSRSATVVSVKPRKSPAALAASAKTEKKTVEKQLKVATRALAKAECEKEQALAQVARLQARMDDAVQGPEQWFFIDDAERQVAFAPPLSALIEAAVRQKRWFHDISVDDSVYVRVFSADDVRLFRRDDKDDLLGRRVERGEHEGKRGSPYPSHFPPVPSEGLVKDEPSGMDAIPAQFRGMFGGSKAVAAAPAADDDTADASALAKERALRKELEAEIQRVQADRMVQTERLVREKMAAKSKLIAEQNKRKQLAEQVAALQAQLNGSSAGMMDAMDDDADSASSSSSSSNSSSSGETVGPLDASRDPKVLAKQLAEAKAEILAMRARMAHDKVERKRVSLVLDAPPLVKHAPDSALKPVKSSLKLRKADIDPDAELMAEERRLKIDARREANWKRWGPYLSERQWGTVREDYSSSGDAWNHLSHDMARSKAYRWGEDGLLGLCDRQCRLAFSVALWNERDAILKERLFGLTNNEGNHGEDVKEEYYYIKSTPTHSYMHTLYKYPHAAFPYGELLAENGRRTRTDPEFELKDTGVFDDEKYFDVDVHYAKVDTDDIFVRITVTNCALAGDAQRLHVLPTLWFRNQWSWDVDSDGQSHNGVGSDVPSSIPKPRIARKSATLVRTTEYEHLGEYEFCVDPVVPHYDAPLPPPSAHTDNSDANVTKLPLSDCLLEPVTLMFTENETNFERFGDRAHHSKRPKDLFHAALCHGDPKVRAAAMASATGATEGSKCSVHIQVSLPPCTSTEIRLRLREVKHDEQPEATLFERFDDVFAQRLREHDLFYGRRIPTSLSEDERQVAIGAYAGLMFSKQFYHYAVQDWLKGDPAFPPPDDVRKGRRNHKWKHFFARDVMLMPDSWEYPWFATWDLAFHAVAVAPVDGHLAKEQLLLFLREWYMSPSGCLPAYEWAFGDVNPPVHAWAVWRVYRQTNDGDVEWLSRCFQKLLLNFTWWVNRKDPDGKGVFAGGFLGLDNIGVFDRSAPLPTGGGLEQADGTAWMGFYAIAMLKIALELARTDSIAYADMASKFFEHFVQIADAMNNIGGAGLWDQKDGFYYDALRDVTVMPSVKTPEGEADEVPDHETRSMPLRIRSIVGLVPLYATGTLASSTVEELKGFVKRTQWFLEHRSDLAEEVAMLEVPKAVCNQGGHVESDHMSDAQQQLLLLSIAGHERAERVLKYALDESEFLSPYGLRSMSKFHEKNPYVLEVGGHTHSVEYVAGESNSAMFGGNSSWRGPIWLPMNYLFVEALERMHHFYGDSLKVEYPTGSGNEMPLDQVANDLCGRLVNIFMPAEDGSGRPALGGDERYQRPRWKKLLLFHEYFNGDNGAGLGASHQTGWTALVADCLRKMGRLRTLEYRVAQYYFPQARLRSYGKVREVQKLTPGSFAVTGGAPMVLTLVLNADAPLVKRIGALRTIERARGLSADDQVDVKAVHDVEHGGYRAFVNGAVANGGMVEHNTALPRRIVLVHRAIARLDAGFMLFGEEPVFPTVDALLLYDAKNGLDVEKSIALDDQWMNRRQKSKKRVLHGHK